MELKYFLSLLILPILLFFPVITEASLDDWTSLQSQITDGIKFGTSAINSIAYGNGIWVAVGDYGLASYSADGITWTALTAGDDTGIKFGTTTAYSVTYGNDKFVAVGGSGKASYSADGITWTALTAGVSTGIKFGTTTTGYSVTYGNDKFVAVGSNGKASYSADGITWTALTGGSTSAGIKFGYIPAYSVTYGNDKFVAVGSDGKASYSADGITWTALTPGTDTGIKFGTTIAYSVTYGNGKFVVVGLSGKASYSADGITWTALIAGLETGIRFGGSFAYSITYGNKTWVAVGDGSIASYCFLNLTPNIVSISDSPDPIKGGSQITITPTGQADDDSDDLYFYCNESGAPTSADTVCSEANTSYSSGNYGNMSCTYNVDTGDTTRTVYCRVYDGTAYSSETTTTYTVDSTAPTVSVGTNQVKGSQFTQIALVSDSSSEIDETSYQWSKISGPGNVTFGSADSESTTISADKNGIYIIQFRVSDNAGNSATDNFTLTWNTGGGGLPHVAYYPPTPPSEGFKILINNNSVNTNSSRVNLSFVAGKDVKNVAISNFSDFRNAWQEPFENVKQWDLCQQRDVCPYGEYTVYVKFYTQYGQPSETITKTILYTNNTDDLNKEIPSQHSYAFNRYLSYGDTGEDVLELQKILVQLGFLSAEPNGHYGPATTEAIKKFQKANDIKQVGVVGPITKDALNDIDIQNTSSEELQQQQQNLNFDNLIQEQINQIKEAIQKIILQIAEKIKVQFDKKQ